MVYCVSTVNEQLASDHIIPSIILRRVCVYTPKLPKPICTTPQCTRDKEDQIRQEVQEVKNFLLWKGIPNKVCPFIDQ